MPRSVLLPKVGLLDRALKAKGAWWKGTRRVLTAEGSLAWVRVRVRVGARARVRVREHVGSFTIAAHH